MVFVQAFQLNRIRNRRHSEASQWRKLGGTFLPQYLINNIINPALPRLPPPQKINLKQQTKLKHQQSHPKHLSGRPGITINRVLCL